jgi:hypothetical protein
MQIETFLLINDEEIPVTVSATLSREPEHGTDGRHYVTEVTLDSVTDDQGRFVPVDNQYEQLVEEVIEAAAMADYSAQLAKYEARRERLDT